MGVVYRAEDEKLGRHVALKVLQPATVGDEERRLRLIREARSAAAVTHPHIATIHEIDEIDGVIFIAMELVEGKTLAEAISGRPLPLREVLRYAMEVAEALARAHASGVVHRDLKPENIVVGKDRHVKILDFGLAKLEEPAGGGDQETRMQTISTEMTKAGRVLGTPAYMSPEQARGVEVDARSDLFSFGIILYEMITGTLPFRGETATDTLLAIVRDPHRAAREHDPGIPPELERIIAKCLEKVPQDRYQHADDIVVDLRRLKRETDSQDISPVTTIAPAVTGAGWFTPRRMLLGLVGLAALAVAVLLIVRAVVPPVEGGVRSLAVMPLINLKDETDPERLGQILQELIITDLSELGSLTVLSSQRLFDVQEQLGHTGTRTIDRELASEVAARADATTMLTGTLSQLQDRWILACQLVNVADGAVIKSERVDGTDLYTMVDEFTTRIRGDLGLVTTTDEAVEVAVKDKTTSSIEAYQHYLAGIDHLNVQEYEDAALELNRAVQIDPTFGAGYYKLAVAGWWLSSRIPSTWFADHDVPTAEASLDRLLGGGIKLTDKERRLAEAMKPLVTDEYAEARAPCEALVARYPDDKEAWYALGEAEFHASGGSNDRAREAFEKALELDPSFLLAYAHIFDLYDRKRLFPEAEARAKALVEMDPGTVTWYAKWVGAAIRAEDPEAETVLEKSLAALKDPGGQRAVLQGAAGAWGDVDDIPKAISCLERALAIDTEDGRAEALTALGAFHRDLLENAKAMDCFLKAHDADPRASSDMYWRLAQIYEDEGRFGDGILRFRAWCDQNPGLQGPADAWIRLAVQRGDEDEVARAVETSMQREENPLAPDRYARVAGDAYEMIGNRPRARAEYRRALETDPEHENDLAEMGLARIDLHLRDYAAAEAGMRAVLRDKGKDVFRLWWLTQCLLASRKYAEALELYGGDEVDEDDPLPFKNQHARILVASGRLQEADAFVEAVLPFMWNRDQLNLLNIVAGAFLGAGYPGRAEALYRRLLDLPSSTAPNLWRVQGLMRALEAQGRLDDARTVLADLRRLQPRRRATDIQEAELELLRGNAPAAEAKLRGVLEQGPDLFSRTLMVFALSEQGRFREALPIARTILEWNPVRESNELLAWVLIAGDIDVNEGVGLAEKALGMPEYGFHSYHRFYEPSARHCLGLAYLKRGEREKAVNMLKAAAAERPDRPLIQEHLSQAQGGS